MGLTAAPDLLRALFDSSPWPMWIFDRETFAFLRVNDAALRDYGYAREEFLAMTVLDIRPPEDVPAMREAAARAASDHHGRRGLWRHRKKDGSLIEVVVQSVELELGGRQAILALVRDVTDELAAERALRRSEASFRAAIELSPDLVAIARQGRLAYVNHAVASALRYPGQDAILGRDVLDLVSSEDRPRARALLERAARADPAPPTELHLDRADGCQVLAEVSAAVIEFEGEPALLAFARDLTERRRLEARLAIADRMSSLGTLAAGVAHEINNPVSYALANLGFVADRVAPLLAGSQDRVEVEAALRDARQGVERVRDIVRDLKTFSRADDGMMVAVELHAVLDVACGMAAVEIRHRARLVKAYAAGPLHVRGNEGKLAQVFLNLLLNAAHAIHEGSVAANAVTVATSRREDGRVAVEVRDTGCGIRPEHLGLLFDPFFTTKPSGIGTGLGLSICHGIVRAHGGAIEVESEPGRGACFRVLLDAARPGAERPVVARPQPCRRCTVLVVDDEPLVCEAVARALGNHHEVVKASGAASAIALVRAGRRFDAILCDVMMPEATGLQLLALLLREAPEQARRLAFITAGVFSEEARRLVKETARPVVEKPFTKDALLACVRVLAGG